MVLGAVTVTLILSHHGGVAAAIESLRSSDPDLLVREGTFSTVEFASYTLIPLSAGMVSPSLHVLADGTRRRHLPVAHHSVSNRYPVCSLGWSDDWISQD